MDFVTQFVLVDPLKIELNEETKKLLSSEMQFWPNINA